MQQSLVLLVPRAELLQEQVSVPDDLQHLQITLQTDRQRREKVDIERTFILLKCSLLKPKSQCVVK